MNCVECVCVLFLCFPRSLSPHLHKHTNEDNKIKKNIIMEIRCTQVMIIYVSFIFTIVVTRHKQQRGKKIEIMGPN